MKTVSCLLKISLFCMVGGIVYAVAPKDLYRPIHGKRVYSLDNPIESAEQAYMLSPQPLRFVIKLSRGNIKVRGVDENYTLTYDIDGDVLSGDIRWGYTWFKDYFLDYIYKPQKKRRHDTLLEAITSIIFTKTVEPIDDKSRVDIELLVPKKSHVNIRTDDGSIDIEGIEDVTIKGAKDIKIKHISGYVDLANVTGNIEIDHVSGLIKMVKKDQEFGHIKVHNVEGNLKIHAPKVSDLDISYKKNDEHVHRDCFLRIGDAQKATILIPSHFCVKTQLWSTTFGFKNEFDECDRACSDLLIKGHVGPMPSNLKIIKR